MEIKEFIACLNEEQRLIFQNFKSPNDIQAFLDTTIYPSENINRSALRVLNDRRCHCLDGGLVAAVGLKYLGHPARIVDILPEPGTDDDHILAIYQVDGCYGAVAKSNYVGLRYREPVYRSLRELVMSYFEMYYSIDGHRTLRYYTLPVRLEAYNHLNWLVEDAGVDALEKHLYQLKHYPLLTQAQIAHLTPVDARSYEAGMLGVNLEGVYRPKVKPI